jgi:hypothetical protein
MTHEEIVRALGHLYPEAKYVLSGDDIENIDWQSTDIECPDFAKLEKAYADSLAAEKKAAELASVKKSEVLERLGITADEAKLLLG